LPLCISCCRCGRFSSATTAAAARATWHLGVGEVDRWVVTAFCGPLAEIDRFGGDAEEDGDLKVIRAMLERLDLHWGDRELAEHFFVGGLVGMREELQPPRIADDAALRSRRCKRIEKRPDLWVPD
jgi:hypothetical protein